MSGVGLLHTVPALADTFGQRLTAAEPGLVLTHVADPSLLARAIATGVDDEVRARVLAHVRHLAATGADAVMVTCSSIGEAAEAAAEQVDLPVLRVDLAMAEEAVALARVGRGRVAVLATLRSTLGPTERLLQRVAAGEPPAVVVDARLVEGAADARAAGNHQEHDRLVREAVAEAGAEADAVVLAQASMAAAVAGAEGPGVRVLESVSTGSARLLAVLQAAAGGSGDGQVR